MIYRQTAVHVGRISYMNVALVYHQLDNGLRPAWLKMITAPPSVLNTLLEKGVLDVSPVSSAAYARNQDEWHLLPDLSIACHGKVMSVLLLSQVPLDQLEGQQVLITDESASAAELLKLLFSRKKIYPLYTTGAIRKPADIHGSARAALVIGDAALSGRWDEHFPYQWDLGAMWKDITGLPFVFAVWAVRKSFAERFPEVVATIYDLFLISKKDGRKHLDEIACSVSAKLGLGLDVCRTYYHQLQFDLTSGHIQGLETFFDGLYQANLISKPVQLSFFQPDA